MLDAKIESTDDNNPDEPNGQSNIAMPDNKKNNMENNLMSAPMIPDMVYEQLPEFLKKCISPFIDQREKDVMLTSSLAVLSACFTNCKGKYRNDWVGSNLYSFIVAPPASAKSR